MLNESVHYQVIAKVTDKSWPTPSDIEFQPELQIYTYDLVNDLTINGFRDEQSFAAAWAMGFLNNLKSIGIHQGIQIPRESAVTVNLNIGHKQQSNEPKFELEIEVMLPGLARESAERMVSEAKLIQTVTDLPVNVYISRPEYHE